MEAYHDIWFLGDSFLKEVRDAVFELRRAGLLKKTPNIPYIFKHFNVSGHYAPCRVSNIISHLTYALVEVLNTKPRLPKYLVVIPDKDYIESLWCNSGISIMLGAALHYYNQVL